MLKNFEWLFFKKFVEDMIIPETNEEMKNRGNVSTYSEFLVSLDIWFLLAAIIGTSWKEGFSSLPIDHFDNAPFGMDGYMMGQWFEQILTALRFTTKYRPNSVDRFWHVHDIITAWKDNIL